MPSFSDFLLSPKLLAWIGEQGFQEPTPIQVKAVPSILEGRDLLGVAKTGSGKTASYVLPILERLARTDISHHREPAVLVLVPTRELADQVHHVFQSFGKAFEKQRKCRAVYGGVSINPQMKGLKDVDILIATPGRLLDLLSRNALKLSSVRTLVLDEADKMLNVSFRDEMAQLVKLLPERRQNLLFSATLNPKVTGMQELILKNAIVVEIETEHGANSLITQVAYAVEEERKGPFLRYLIQQGELEQVLVFASSAFVVDRVVTKLWKNKIRVAAMHSKLAQTVRRQNLADFKEGRLRVLVATDLLARGVDVSGLPHVINYELPRSPKDYVHRIGRTGRADCPGEAISLISPAEEHHFRVIQKKTGHQVVTLPTDEIVLHGY